LDAARAQATARARAALARRSAGARERFERALDTALRYYPLREDTTFWLAQIAGAGRLTVLEAGRRLAARGDLDRPGDAAQLEVETLRAALTGSQRADLRAYVARARAERAWVIQHPGPQLVGPPPGPPPDVRALPAPGRRLNAALLWAQPTPPRPVEDTTAVLTGVPGSPGRHTGPVRTVRGPDDFAALLPGEVLVAPTTDPAWSVLFGVAGALVTDGGGVLSHAAIVAREHALPAVVGTGRATSTLHDGEVVTVDGSTGRVLRTNREEL
ncbi:MAG: PEP-utilizing enzyme, partial [Marmoricola sp.]